MARHPGKCQQNCTKGRNSKCLGSEPTIAHPLGLGVEMLVPQPQDDCVHHVMASIPPPPQPRLESVLVRKQNTVQMYGAVLALAHVHAYVHSTHQA